MQTYSGYGKEEADEMQSSVSEISRTITSAMFGKIRSSPVSSAVANVASIRQMHEWTACFFTSDCFSEMLLSRQMSKNGKTGQKTSGNKQIRGRLG